MTKPENLADKTSRDWDVLIAAGWRPIGSRRAKYGMHYYWDRPENGGWSKQYLMGTAVRLTNAARKRHKEATRG